VTIKMFEHQSSLIDEFLQVGEILRQARRRRHAKQRNEKNHGTTGGSQGTTRRLGEGTISIMANSDQRIQHSHKSYNSTQPGLS